MVKIDLVTEAEEKELEFIRRFIKVIEEMVEARCKYCGSPNIVKNGKSRKGIQNWLCRDCGKGFVDNKALPTMKSPIKHVASAIYLYYTGLSLNKIRRHIEQQYGVLPSDSTIYNWIKRFTKIAVDEAKKYTPKVGDVWVADETVLRIGGEKLWLIDIIDRDTRCLLATQLSATRGRKDIALLLRKAYLKAGKAPERIITDGWGVYPDAVDLVFGGDTKHVQSTPFVEVDSTNIIERFQGSLKERTKVMRGMKKKETARLLLDGWLVYYNFFRPHESLKDKTPAEVAQVKFPYKNWLDIVKSQLPIAQIVETKRDKMVVISADYGTKTKSIRRRRVSKQQAMRMVTPTISTMRERR